MDKQDMIRRFTQKSGSYFMNRTELAECMGRSNPHQVDWILSGLERTANGKLYYIPDIIERIKEGVEIK